MPEKTVNLPRLRALREDAFLTQAELAKKSGVSHPTVVRLESGKTAARLPTVRKLAQALGVEPVELTR